jgi:site-specific recombinase XerD
MNDPSPAPAISPLRQRLIDDMNVRRFSRETQRNYICDVGRLATFLRRSPDTATADDVRRFQIEQRDAGVPTPTMNSIVSALRFFFTHTIDRPDLARKAIRVAHPRKPARGAEPARGCATAQRDHLPQASGSSLGRLWRWPARG